MKMEGLHEKEIFERSFPFRLIINRQNDFHYPPHWHRAVELVYALRNTTAVDVDSKSYSLREKDILYLPGGAVHGFPGGTHGLECVFINFELSALSGFSDTSGFAARLRGVRHITPADGPLHAEIEGQLLRILAERQTTDAVSELFYTARMIDILVALYHSVFARADFGAPDGRGAKSAGLEKLDRAFAYLETHYAEDIRLKDAAEAAGFSQSYFSRLFKEVAEENFHDYLNSLRLKKAETLLADSDCTIAEAAYAAGFSSITTFDRLFRRTKGCSPRRFRTLRLGEPPGAAKE